MKWALDPFTGFHLCPTNNSVDGSKWFQSKISVILSRYSSLSKCAKICLFNVYNLLNSFVDLSILMIWHVESMSAMNLWNEPLASTHKKLKLPSLFASWFFWTFHNKSHNMEALVILKYWWSLFLPFTCLYGKELTLWVSLRLFGVFNLEKNLSINNPDKWHDSDHQWPDLVLACLP